MTRFLINTAATLALATGIAATPAVYQSMAEAAHGTIADGNNGHGNNRNADGEKADDVSNPTYNPSEDGEDGTDGNSGIGDDKNGNNGRGGGNR